MSPSLSASRESRIVPPWSSASPMPALATLVYRSQAVHAMSDADLEQLVESARQRNRAAAVTGLLVYDEGRFLQWLEGPAEAVARVWSAIRRDPRHTNIEVLGDAPSAVRFFPGWDMKLGTRRLDAGETSDGKILIAANLIATLRRQPDRVVSLLASLGPSGAALLEAGHPLAITDHDRLRALVEDVVVPRLVANILPASDLPASPPGMPDPRLAQLARLLMEGDPTEAFQLFDRLQADAGSLRLACATVTEPVARGLGDLWAADDCSEFDVALGLARLQQAFRRQQLEATPLRLCRAPARVVLVAPQPGEPHLLGSVLDAELLWRAGWETHCEFPVDDAALQALVAGTWFDAVDLSLSTAFERGPWAPRMAASIAAARRASCNPAVAVIVGGRLFYERREDATQLAFQLGANAINTTAANVVRLLQPDVLPEVLGQTLALPSSGS